MFRFIASTATVALLGCGLAPPAHAACRKVQEEPSIAIAPDAGATLEQMGISRKLAFQILVVTATPETQGCWSGATGNFDGQVLSVGPIQWNFGQNSLQRSLRLFKKRYLQATAFEAEKSRLMPKYGDLIFSDGCTSVPISAACKQDLIKLQDSRGVLNADFKAEIDALFNSDTMVQISTDRFIALLTSVRDALTRLFGNGPKTLRTVKWALDTKVQQGSFPKGADVREMRAMSARLVPADRQKKMLGTVTWYKGLCASVWSEGCRLDYEYNTRVWTQEISSRYSDDRFDLLNLSQMRAMAAGTKSGKYQANAFERRATIVFGIGSVAGRIFRETN